jgi:DNA-directed RNA polymerase subunit K/omega
MEPKKTGVSSNTITRNVKDVQADAINIYEAINVIAKRADQISREVKTELNSKLEEFASYTDNLEEIFENREQIEISKYYERMPKPVLIATQEMIEGTLKFRRPEEE